VENVLGVAAAGSVTGFLCLSVTEPKEVKTLTEKNVFFFQILAKTDFGQFSYESC